MHAHAGFNLGVLNTALDWIKDEASASALTSVCVLGAALGAAAGLPVASRVGPRRAQLLVTLLYLAAAALILADSLGQHAPTLSRFLAGIGGCGV